MPSTMPQPKVSSLYASQLNNHALGLFLIGDFIDAERCLNRALLTSTMKERPDTEDYNFIEQERQQQRDQETIIDQYPHECHNNEGECNDQGMRVYCDPIAIPITSTHEEKTIQKTIIYNLGVGYLWLHEYEEAYAYFSNSLQATHKSACQTESSDFRGPSDVMILHNLGYVNFTQGRYFESESCSSAKAITIPTLQLA